jgi:hypothetical protein
VLDLLVAIVSEYPRKLVVVTEFDALVIPIHSFNLFSQTE